MGKIDKKIKEAQEEVVYWWTQIGELHEAGKLDEEMAQKIVARIQDLASLIEVWKELQ